MESTDAQVHDGTDDLAPVALSLPVRLRFTCIDAYFVGEYHTPYSEIALWANGAGGTP